MSQRTSWTEKQYKDFLKRTKTPQAPGNGNPAVTPRPKWKNPVAGQQTKTEAEFEAILKSDYPESRVLFQAYTLKLAPYCKYTPDFALVHDQTMVDFYEVKGAFIFSKAMNKPKIAAAIFPQHRFFLAQKKDGKWKVRQLPA